MRQISAKDLVGPAQATVLSRGGIVEILQVHSQAGGDVVTDQVQPLTLFRGKGPPQLGLLIEPVLAAFMDVVRVGYELAGFMQGQAHETDQVGDQVLGAGC